ncbi:hypothetical protein GCM10027280_31340 [Micromonospora polyrhachis]|uniref:DNA-binding protein YbaB n=1 Tax=Micromonospora polyrhachis TaxID=1282883 RepID=A0A7W7SUK7_9ACTN|nr:hypothetical protein [Micromonospora polyrhachis]MBB4961161.1 DNA-binding protein YbaB [Micromonospora polyrhachis]
MRNARQRESASPIDRLIDLRDRTLALRRVIGAATNSTPRYRGRDATRLVSVAAGGNGRVEAVDIDEGWFHGRGASGLGPALLEAYQAAMAEVLRGAVERIEEAGEEGRPSFVETSTPTPSVEPFSYVTFDDVEEALRAFDRGLAERREHRTAAPPDGERVLHGPYSLVTIVVRDGAITAIRVESHVTRSQVRLVRQDAVAAFGKLGA